jgi:hypothetical protein
MSEGTFKYEDCLLKHYIRTEAWLPLCAKRKRALKQARTRVARERRLRYFTFCAVGAVDVLMLDLERVIRPDDNGRFNTVCFFDANEDYVYETQKRIPGARGFPGDFVEIVLEHDPEDDTLVDELAPLTSATDRDETLATQREQQRLAQRRKFILEFPFDVINFDLEEFLFQPATPPPGRVMNAFRKVFEWQRRPLRIGRSEFPLDGFSLMLTTQIGPQNLPGNYVDQLRRYLEQNINQDADLRPILVQRTGLNDLTVLSTDHFEEFFRLSIPKALLKLLMEEDWYVDPTGGISFFEIERQWKDGTYKMLHLVMDVRRQNPDCNHRFPGAVPNDALDAYRTVVRRIFSTRQTIVTDALIDRQSLQTHLDRIKIRRNKYLGEN